MLSGAMGYLMNPTGIRIPMNTLPDVSLRAFPESLWPVGLNVGGTIGMSGEPSQATAFSFLRCLNADAGDQLPPVT